MTPHVRIKIRLTTDQQEIAFCSQMMSVTDPWITLKMNYEQCLKAFKGDYKEIYVVETENTIAGFVIIQTCGTFSGYIQTICIDEAYRGKGFGKKLLQFCE
jgi:ribosomal protein S18 acetylase RimI-like enzyme